MIFLSRSIAKVKLPVVKKLHGNFFKRHRSAKHEDVSKIFDRTQIF